MNFSLAKAHLVRNLSNIPGWRTSRKILVVESDDWGSIRMPSKEAYNQLQSKGLNVSGGDGRRYNMSDTLASSDDLSALFELLSSYKDKYGNPCAFTAVSVVANPDFEKIKANDFTAYYYEPFTRTLDRYYSNSKPFETWQQGINNRLFIPQFHGREHLNVAEWMRALQANDRETHQAFDQGVWGFMRKNDRHPAISYQAAFDFHDSDDLKVQSKAIEEGLSLFYELFGFKASFFVPPNGPFSRSLNEVAANNGIRYLLAPKIQLEPQGQGRNKRVFHWLGQRNKFNQLFMVRNCFFEPGKVGKDWVSCCLKDIEIAFRWGKPAVISSHRVNYIGAMDPKNRKNGLAQLQSLLNSIVINWPDVEFMTSNNLGELINNG